MLLCSLFLLFLSNEVNCQINPCTAGPRTTDSTTACRITANAALNDRFILMMNSSHGFTLNFVDDMDPAIQWANATLLKLIIHPNRVLLTCISKGGAVNPQNDVRYYENSTILQSPIGRPFSISAGFYGSESLPIAKLNIDEEKMERANKCEIELKPYGKYIQLFFAKGLDYEIFAAMKCVKK